MVNMLRFYICLATMVILFLGQPAVVAASEPGSATVDPAEVIAYQGTIRLTQLELDAAFSKLPEGERLRFIRDGARVDQLIRALLRRKAIAADAAQAGYDQNPLVATRVALEAEKELAEAWIQHLVAEISAADYEALAHEDYLANPDRYRTPESLDVSHILVGTTERSVAEARSLAESLANRLREEPEAFDEMVKEYSDDPAKINNGGRYREMRRGMMAEPFEQAAFALEEPGAISEPVQTDYGWHIIRLNGRSGNELRSFDEVKDEAVARARQDHVNRYRENYLARVAPDPVIFPEGAVEIMAKRHFGENLELAPDFSK